MRYPSLSTVKKLTPGTERVQEHCQVRQGNNLVAVKVQQIFTSFKENKAHQRFELINKFLITKKIIRILAYKGFFEFHRDKTFFGKKPHHSVSKMNMKL